MIEQPSWASIKSEPLGLTDLCRIYNRSPKTMRKDLERIPGVEVFGKRCWRIPVGELPMRYLIEIGLVRPVSLSPVRSAST